MRTAVAFVLAFPILWAPGIRAATPFTIEQVLSSPFPDDLVASPHGDAIAWVLNSRGVRNIWVARAPDFMGAPVTKFSQDDGQELGEIAWKTDGSAVFFTRGGSANGRGEFPNPRSNTEGIKQEIWTAPLPGDARKLGDGHSPAVAPDGSGVAWLQAGQIWWLPSGGDQKPVQLIHARGNAEDLQWSPDSRMIAFTSSRGDHAFIGLYDVRLRSLTFPDPSVDRDQSPAWSQDGRQLAFIRLPAARDISMFGPKRTGDPWSIRVVDSATGKGREVWRAQPGMGSVFWPMTAAHQLLWITGNRIVFPWERDGWQHLFAVSLIANKEIRLLTPGEFEIEYAAAGPDGNAVFFSSNQNDIDRRHIWRVAGDGKPPQQLTPGSGIEWSPAPLAGGQLAILRSDARMPARPALLSVSNWSGNVHDLQPSQIPTDFPLSLLTEPEQVIFPAGDGTKIHAQLFLPPGGAPRHPAVVFFHGGSRREMLLGWHHMFYYHQAYGFNQYLASRGYVVLSVNYRSGVGYGEQFREALHYGATGGSEFSDVIGAGLYLRSRADVDPERIGVWGGSYGGYLTAMALSRASDVFSAGVDLHGVHDWNLEISNTLPPYESDKRQQVARIAFESSPMSSINTWRSPVLLIQGDDDRNVPFAETVQLAEALRRQGVYFEQLIFPDEIHDFLLNANWVIAYKAADEFLSRFLKL